MDSCPPGPKRYAVAKVHVQCAGNTNQCHWLFSFLLALFLRSLWKQLRSLMHKSLWYQTIEKSYGNKSLFPLRMKSLWKQISISIAYYLKQICTVKLKSQCQNQDLYKEAKKTNFSSQEEMLK